MKFSKKIFFVILGVIFLIALNIFGFYLNQEGLRISDSLEHAQSKQQFIKNQEFPFSEIIIFLVFIFDLAIILFLLFMILKFIFKKLKTSKI